MTRIIVISVLQALLVSCSIFSSEKTSGPVELKATKSEALQGTAAELLDKGKEHYAHQLYSIAEESFQSLLLQYPTSPYAEFAEMKKADCKFFTGNYADAAALYEAFVKDRPGSAASSYALFALARSQHLAYQGLGRDTTPLIRAKDTYKKVMEQHPDKLFAKAAAEHINAIDAQLHESQERIIKFYEETGHSEAAKERLRKLEQS